MYVSMYVLLYFLILKLKITNETALPPNLKVAPRSMYSLFDCLLVAAVAQIVLACHYRLPFSTYIRNRGATLRLWGHISDSSLLEALKVAVVVVVVVVVVKLDPPRFFRL